MIFFFGKVRYILVLLSAANSSGFLLFSAAHRTELERWITSVFEFQ